MKTKAYHAFEQKIIYFDDDITMIDIIRTNILNGELTDKNSTHVLKNLDPVKHRHLIRRKNVDGSRKLLINHLRQTVYSSYIKDLYEEVTHYLRTILEKSAANGFDAGRIIGEHPVKFDAKAILIAGDWKSIARLITDSVFQALEAEKSTLKLFEKISSKLALGVDDGLIKSAIPYLEVRHYLVHADGRAPSDFKDKYPDIRIQRGYFLLNYSFVENLKTHTKNLVKAFDEAVVAKNLLKNEDLQP
ncbi:hypothetical protein [Alcaligenes parafaecalis]|uniref:Uncharacterized protein n=1 Tax=Alcaligenes parafaecalis TaxID=171260 RepID=A0ABT3VH98_9BURK|nr:hypothetical protein [Alcaligenes parafaecalis]MCX5462858.1 hypothetical protein [Alcaligenes parafaecalis]